MDAEGLYLEDLKPESVFYAGPLTVEQADIVAFGRAFDPQQFHVDAAAAKRTVFEGLCASGWHTAALTMKLLTSGELKLAGGHVGLGIDELRWPRPVRPGDSLSLRSELLEARKSKSKPGFGIARFRHTTTNQDGQTVQTMVSTQLVRAL
jgi:acyl dehydratase